MAEPHYRPVRRTRWQALLSAALFGAAAGWLVVAGSRALGRIAPLIPWTAPAALWLLVVVVGVLARSTRQRIQVRRAYIEPQRAVTFLVLGKSAALAGAAIAAGYLAFGLFFVDHLEAASPRDRVIKSGIAVVAGIGVCIAGLLLEGACQVPPGGGDNDRDDNHRDDNERDDSDRDIPDSDTSDR